MLREHKNYVLKRLTQEEAERHTRKRRKKAGV
jgi:hypothetical protein